MSAQDARSGRRRPFAHEAWAIGDVDGNGQASVLFQSIGPRDHRFGVWDQPMSASPLYEGIWTDYVFNTGAGIGDFNGDGRSDILLWNEGAGTILLMGSAQVIGATPEVIGTIPVKPTRSDIWSVAGVGDIDQNGYSDIILRDPRGNIQLLSFGATPEPTPHYLPVRDFSYGTGTFDSSWQVAGDWRPRSEHDGPLERHALPVTSIAPAHSPGSTPPPPHPRARRVWRGSCRSRRSCRG